jgi:hypothetical protein
VQGVEAHVTHRHGAPLIQINDRDCRLHLMLASNKRRQCRQATISAGFRHPFIFDETAQHVTGGTTCGKDGLDLTAETFDDARNITLYSPLSLVAVSWSPTRWCGIKLKIPFETAFHKTMAGSSARLYS